MVNKSINAASAGRSDHHHQLDGNRAEGALKFQILKSATYLCINAVGSSIFRPRIDRLKYNNLVYIVLPSIRLPGRSTELDEVPAEVERWKDAHLAAANSPNISVAFQLWQCY